MAFRGRVMLTYNAIRSHATQTRTTSATQRFSPSTHTNIMFLQSCTPLLFAGDVRVARHFSTGPCFSTSYCHMSYTLHWVARPSGKANSFGKTYFIHLADLEPHVIGRPEHSARKVPAGASDDTDAGAVHSRASSFSNRFHISGRPIKITTGNPSPFMPKGSARTRCPGRPSALHRSYPKSASS